MAKGIDWIKIKLYYETHNISYRKISDKFGVSFKTLQEVAKREEWAKCKKETQDKIRTKTGQKTISKIIDRNAKFLELSDLASSAIEEYLIDKHYKQHIVKYKYYDDEGKADYEELKAVELPVADTKALSNIISSLEKIQKGHRIAEGKDKPTEQANENQLDSLMKVMLMGGAKRKE